MEHAEGSGQWQVRAEVTTVIRRGVLQAEEKYLIDPEATLGTWFARVEETIAVASRITLARIDEGRSALNGEIAAEQIGLFADICAEAIRGAARIWGPSPSPHTTEMIITFAADRAAIAGPPSWATILATLARCSAALEPIANGLREADLPMGEPTDCDQVCDCLIEVAACSCGGLYALI